MEVRKKLLVLLLMLLLYSLVCATQCRFGQFKIRSGATTTCQDCKRCPTGFNAFPPCDSSHDYRGIVNVTQECIQCKSRTFQSRESVFPCKRCSVCPKYRAVVRSCSRYSDTICASRCSFGKYMGDDTYCYPCCRCHNEHNFEPLCVTVQGKNCRAYDNGICKEDLLNRTVPSMPIAKAVLSTKPKDTTTPKRISASSTTPKSPRFFSPSAATNHPRTTNNTSTVKKIKPVTKIVLSTDLPKQTGRLLTPHHSRKLGIHTTKEDKTRYIDIVDSNLVKYNMETVISISVVCTLGVTFLIVIVRIIINKSRKRLVGESIFLSIPQDHCSGIDESEPQHDRNLYQNCTATSGENREVEISVYSIGKNKDDFSAVYHVSVTPRCSYYTPLDSMSVKNSINTCDSEVVNVEGPSSLHFEAQPLLDCACGKTSDIPTAISSHAPTVERYPNDDEVLMKVSRCFDENGGTLMADDTSVKLDIPPGAIPRGEKKEIFFIVYVHRPNDWKLLKKRERFVDTPIVDFGPSGTTFQRPVRVTFQNGLHENPNEINFQFCEGEYNKDAIWIDAAQAHSEGDAEEKSMNERPNVSYFVTKKQTIVYYLHFTGGRKESGIPDKAQFETTMYANHLENVGSWKALADSLQMFQERQKKKDRNKVAANDKQFILYNTGNPIKVQMNNQNKSLKTGGEKDVVNPVKAVGTLKNDVFGWIYFNRHYLN